MLPRHRRPGGIGALFQILATASNQVTVSATAVGCWPCNARRSRPRWMLSVMFNF